MQVREQSIKKDKLEALTEDMRFFCRHDGKMDEAEMEAINAVNMFPWFWCDRCGQGPYRFAHYVDGMKLCSDCWLRSLPKRKR